jgi:hypothetical protein
MTSATSPGPIAQAIMGTPLFEKVVNQDNSLKNRIGLEVANLQEATKVIVENHYLHRGRTMGQIAYDSGIKCRTLFTIGHTNFLPFAH